MAKITKPLTLLFALLAWLPMTAMSEPHSTHFEVEVIGQGKPIILLHGFTSDQRVWDGLAEDLANQYQVHRISLAGFGGIAAQSEPSLQQSKQALLDYIDASVTHKPAVVGHSLGGFMGLWLATSAPTKIGPVVSVDGLPFIGPLFSRDPSVTAKQLKPQAEYFRNFYAGLDPEGMVNAASQGIHIQATNEEHQQHILQMSRESDPATAADAIYTLLTTDLRSQLSDIESHVLLLGASGGFPNDEAKQGVMALYQQQLAAAKHARVEMNTHSRHFIMYDDPEWLASQLKHFLQDSL